METKRETLQDECTAKAHYWVIDGKNFGVCKNCGAKKQFAARSKEWQKRNFVIGKNKTV
jgi:hypothetical protein